MSEKEKQRTLTSGKELDDYYKKLVRLEAVVEQMRVDITMTAEVMHDPNRKIQEFVAFTFVPASKKLDIETALAQLELDDSKIPKISTKHIITDVEAMEQILKEKGIPIPEKVEIMTAIDEDKLKQIIAERNIPVPLKIVRKASIRKITKGENHI